MPRFYAKKLSVIGNASAPMTDSKKNLEESSMDRELETAKCITWNV